MTAPMAPAADAKAGQSAIIGAKTALIIAHGQPSDPGRAAAELHALTARIAVHLPGWQLASATLAEAGAVAQATQGLAPGLVFPLFMASGWFTKTAIPARLEAAGAVGWRVLAPFGELASLQDLALALVRESGAAEVLLAAHGSFKSPVPAKIAQELAARIAAEPGISRAEAAFIDQSPRLAEAHGFGAAAVCLPFFAMAGGHVTDDLPAALAEAAFAGRLLPPLGLDARVPQLIAEAIAQAIAAAP